MPDKSHLQAANGADRTKRSGTNFDQGEGGARKGPGISQKGGAIPANVPGPKNNQSGDNRTPVHSHVAGPRTSVRGGGDRHGHDRTNPTAGKSKSGSKDAQHPNNKRG